MPIDLSGYTNVESALLVKIEVDYYKTSEGATPTAETLLFSDYYRDITYDSNVYRGLGQLVGITSTRSEISASEGDITITLSGIPNTSLAEIIHSRIKGSSVDVYRYLFNAQTGEGLGLVGNPVGRFFGIVDNYTLEENYDIDSKTSSNTISIVCSNTVKLLGNKTSGRKTNKASHRSFYPNDPSMDRVSALIGTSFDFGKPQ